MMRLIQNKRRREYSFLMHGSKEHKFKIYGTDVSDRTDGEDANIDIFYKLGICRIRVRSGWTARG